MQINSNKLSQLALFIVLFFGLILSALYFSYRQKASIDIVLETDYDVSMARDSIGQNKKAKTNYYALVLSWSPGYCQSQRASNAGAIPKSAAYQCGDTQKFGWVVHGLWPQSATARRVSDHPRFCRGDLPPLEVALLEKYLAVSPSLKLLQGEWEKHGACAFNDAKSYFDKQQELFASLKLPDYELKRSDLFAWLRRNNPQLSGKYLGAGRDELQICYDLDWQVINCPKIQF
ncbi:ribonuclease T2 [Pasteurella testudinis DSM 23072]|uniref:Ribonuclease T2 n=1 Tax=Pasteurella testudinis DSM 23072 TaxID=1122938 RepID=A0A1W1UP50_9PAST|nr:ribonuclease T [Pasteurella testudinis]SMB82779.1 ribonuclease T2 [Pasteurella testudinis DSM 23072]SUB52734.1 ribonuclease [Pasteurella testudinis]